MATVEGIQAQLHIWPGWAVYVGPGRRATFHRHLAVEVVIGVSGAVELAEDHATHSCVGVLVPSRVPHSVNTPDTTIVVVWSESRALRQATNGLATLQCLDCRRASEVAQKITAQLASLTPHDLDRFILESLGESAPNAVTLDKRVEQSLETISRWPFAPTSSVITQLADEVQLSPSRLRHLFQAQVGVSLKSYLQWKRLLLTAQMAAQGASLTEAAHTLDFADSAHFSRLFRDSFGLTPSEIFRSQFIQVISRDNF
jgi:AraC family transcriptional regulator